MNCYVINLDRATDRLAFQKEQFVRFGLKFERVPACVDDPAAVNRFRWWCAVLRPRVRGEVGCVLSHVKAAKLMLARGEPCAAIFEDDVRMSECIVEALRMAEEACLRDPKRVVLLGLHHRTKRGEDVAAAGSKLKIVEEDWDFCAEGYVLGREAAKNLTEHQQRVRHYPDAWGYFRKKGWIHLSRVTPPITCQAVEEYASSLGSRYVAANHGFVERCWWKARRVVGVILDALMDGGRLGW